MQGSHSIAWRNISNYGLCIRNIATNVNLKVVYEHFLEKMMNFMKFPRSASEKRMKPAISKALFVTTRAGI
jgi:hypothetical protein